MLGRRAFRLRRLSGGWSARCRRPATFAATANRGLNSAASAAGGAADQRTAQETVHDGHDTLTKIEVAPDQHLCAFGQNLLSGLGPSLGDGARRNPFCDSGNDSFSGSLLDGLFTDTGQLHQFADADSVEAADQGAGPKGIISELPFGDFS